MKDDKEFMPTAEIAEEQAVTEEEVILSMSLFDIESNIKYAIEYGASVEEVGGAILRALQAGKRSYLTSLQMAMELSK